MDKYPERNDRQKLLQSIYETVEGAETDGQIGDVDISIEALMEWGDKEEINEARVIRLFRQLYSEGCVEGNLGESLYSVPLRGKFYSQLPFLYARVSHVTDKGLREIGQLPEAREELLLGLEAAISALRQDPMLSEDEKRQKINWLQQIVDVGKQLTVEGIKSIWRGQIPPPGV